MSKFCNVYKLHPLDYVVDRSEEENNRNESTVVALECQPVHRVQPEARRGAGILYLVFFAILKSSPLPIPHS